jgi:hypothetical protein
LAWRLVELTSTLASILERPVKWTPVSLWWSLLKLAWWLELRPALTWTVYATKETARTVLVRGPIQGAESVVAPRMLISAAVAVATIAL